MNLLEVKNVSLRFGQETVLEHCNFQLQAGEHVALMGPSGSGKSSFLKVISGLYPPTSGTVHLHAERISYLFQEPRLLPWLTAEENVNLVLSDRKDTLELARHWLYEVGLSQSLKKYPAQLSGGMRQRVALARALAYDGQLLLLDEPLSALDQELAEDLITLLIQHTKQKGVIFVTHAPEQAKKAADQIYLLQNKTLKPLP